MPRGSKAKYTDKQKRMAEHIEEGYERRGVPEDEAERRAWATVNKETGGGKPMNLAPARKGGRLGGKAAARRPAAARSRSAKKAAAARRRRGDLGSMFLKVDCVPRSAPRSTESAHAAPARVRATGRRQRQDIQHSSKGHRGGARRNASTQRLSTASRAVSAVLTCAIA